MSKYIIDTDQFEKLFETKAVAVLGIGDNLAVPEEGEKTVWTRMLNVADLEELNSDYINEHFGQLQDEAYQKGFEDGVTKRTDGDACAGCEYEGKTGEHLPCQYCKNAYTNQWRAKKEEIGAGDVVIYNQKKCVVVTPETNEKYASLFDCNGNHYSVSSQNCQKTGEHYNINEILGGLCDD